MLIESKMDEKLKHDDKDTSTKWKKDPDKPKRDVVEALKHIDTFYGNAPPGLVQEYHEKPEDCIPDAPENQQARKFLSKAPTRGLWMPLGKEVKVMKCWRCKAYGHRTGDRECPLFLSGNTSSEKFRYVHEDPMHNFIVESKKQQKEERLQELKALLEATSSSSNSTSSSSSDSTTDSHKRSHKRKKRKKKHKKKKRKLE